MFRDSYEIKINTLVVVSFVVKSPIAEPTSIIIIFKCHNHSHEDKKKKKKKQLIVTLGFVFSSLQVICDVDFCSCNYGNHDRLSDPHTSSCVRRRTSN